ncbi:MAG: hypothetical protein ACT4N8_09505 [Sphingosinicella sp.]|uniref:hypothetical protein n=1 Tax=Sphingosinicella sp. TaxID=1917971 RepID=UPI00403843DB
MRVGQLITGAPDGPPLAPARAAELRDELQQAHHDLLAALATLEELTAEPRPDPGRYPNARWRLSLASRRRRTVTTAACTELLGTASPDEASIIRALIAGEAHKLGESASHVRKWCMDAIAADWSGYCAASNALRKSMRDRITAEQAVLYPLLDRYSR